LSRKTLGVLLIVAGTLLLVGYVILGVMGLQGRPLGINTFGLKNTTLTAFGIILAASGITISLVGEKADRWITKTNLISFSVVFLFFGSYIFFGSLVVRNYGISTDEFSSYNNGKVNYEILTGKNIIGLPNCSNKASTCSYPPLFDVVLYWFAPAGDTSYIYLRRHELTFALFAFSAFIFFLIGKKVFKDWKLGLLASIFLIVSPRIFASSFYNPRDIPFLSTYVIAMFTLIMALEKKNIFYVILHGIAAGIACSVRTPGLIIVPITIIFWLFDLIIKKECWKNYVKFVILMIIFSGIMSIVVYLSFPYLHDTPINKYIESFNIMKQFPWSGVQYFMGINIRNHIPWYYSIVWFSISSPLFYLVLFILGFVILIYKALKIKLLTKLLEMQALYVAAACGILPILAVILMKSNLYTDNRQMYFVYPALLLISVYGFSKFVEMIREKTSQWRLWVGMILVLGMVYPIYFLFRYHPHENVYFNILAGSKMSVIKERYSLDTWGLSVKQGLEYILQTDNNQIVNILFYENSNYEEVGKIDNAKSIWILPPEQRERLIISDTPCYILVTYRNYPLEKPNVPGGNIYYSIKVGDAEILTIFQLEKNCK
jgi:hypothetical protein